MKITTFAAFKRLMHQRCKPSKRKSDVFNHLCERIWFDGYHNKSGLSRETDTSRPVVQRWVDIANSLGCKEGERRQRAQDPDFVVKAEVEQDTPVTNESTADYNRPEYDLSTEELRELIRRRGAFDLKNATTPEHMSKAVDYLAKTQPNLKAPEVSVQLQGFVGSGAARNILDAVASNLDLLEDDDDPLIDALLDSPRFRALLISRLPEALDADPVEDAGPPDDPNQ